MKNVTRTFRCDAKTPTRSNAVRRDESIVRSANQSRDREEAVTKSMALNSRMLCSRRGFGGGLEQVLALKKPLPYGRGSDKTGRGSDKNGRGSDVAHWAFGASAVGCDVDRRGGSALILVVAVLGILFVAGAALLNQVTFSTSTLEAAREARETESAVDAIEQMVLDILGRGFIGPDGLALNPQSRLIAHEAGNPNSACTNGLPGAPDCVLSMPTTAEIAGIHPWLDLIEPTNTDVTGFSNSLQIKLFSNPEFALSSRPGVAPKYAGNPSLVGVKVDVNQPIRGAWDINNSDDGILEFPRDSDGDGIVDTFQFPLPDGVLPRDVQRDLADRLRDPNYNRRDPDRDLDQLWISLKIVPHGAMVDLNWSRTSMIRWLLNDATLIRPTDKYAPQTNEWYLRHRGPMLPRSLPRSPLMMTYGAYLLPPHEQPYGGGAVTASLMSDPTLRQWWGYDFMTDAQAGGSWANLMGDPLAGTYDLVHTVTTISHDDQLMRQGRYPTTGVDWISAMRAEEQSVGMNVFELDSYPAKLAGGAGPSIDPRLGRLKISIPELDEEIDAMGLNDLNDLVTAAPARLRITRLIQEAFLLMLHEHGRLSPQVRAITAAMLTANFVDYADSDVGDEPTPVQVFDLDVSGPTPKLAFLPGSDGATTLEVYGFERQPFITEVYARVVNDAAGMMKDPAQTSFAIELYNPYSTDIDLTNFRLFDAGMPQPLQLAGIGATSMLDEALASPTPARIRARSFLVVYPSALAKPNSIDPASDDEALGTDWSVDQNSRIQLIRRVSGLSGPVDLVVDEFDVTADYLAVNPGATPHSLNLPPNAGAMTTVSWERDNGMWTGTSDSRWRFVVPRVMEYPDDPTPHTLGTFNRFDDTQTFSVHIDVVENLRSFKQAYPTTGSILLLSRMAHVYDPSSGAQLKWTAPFNRINTPAQTLLPRTIATDFSNRENGRIPVFDLGRDPAATPNPLPQDRNASKYKTRGLVQGAEALPWGQLIFDYFTALGLEPCDMSNLMAMNTCDPDRVLPYIDEDGLRVHGRININAAPWVVLASAPTTKIKRMPRGYVNDLLAAVFPLGVANDDMTAQIGKELARSITWYREAMDASALLGARNFEANRDPYDTSAPDLNYAPRQGYGFLTVGELFNVRGTDTVRGDEFGMDGGALRFGPNQREGIYERAIGRMVAMGDWLTTRSHVFTIYGVIRGQFDLDPAFNPSNSQHVNDLINSLRATDQRAIRFQTTVDRLPMFFGRSMPERIGARVQGGYADVRAD